MADGVKCGDNSIHHNKQACEPHYLKMAEDAHSRLPTAQSIDNEAQLILGVRQDLQHAIKDAGWLSAGEKADATKYMNDLVPVHGKQNTNEITTIESKYKHNVLMDSFLKSLHDKATVSFD